MACVRKRRGKWMIDFYDQFGKRHWETVGTNKKEAEEILAKRQLEIKREVYHMPSSVPIFAILAKEWYEGQAEPSVRHYTALQYKGHIKNHLLPFFGNYRVTQITPRVIERYVAKKRKTELSRSTINKTLVTLGSILKYAVKHRYIEHNPVLDVAKVKSRGEEMDKEVVILSPEELRLLLDNASSRYKTLFLTAVLTGMRQGELLGLKWGDIEWNKSQIFVRRTYNHGRFYEPKSKSSGRKIDIPEELLAELKKWKLASPISKLDLVFPNKKGNPQEASNMMRRGYYPALRRVGARQVNFHTLRHTYASLLIAQGEHPKYIQIQMGHSSINITMDTYGHLMEDVNYESPKRLWNAVFNPSGSKIVAETKKGPANFG